MRVLTLYAVRAAMSLIKSLFRLAQVHGPLVTELVSADVAGAADGIVDTRSWSHDQNATADLVADAPCAGAWPDRDGAGQR